MLATLPKPLESSSVLQWWKGGGSRTEKDPLAYGKVSAVALRLRQMTVKKKLTSCQHAPALCAVRECLELQFWEEGITPAP